MIPHKVQLNNDLFQAIILVYFFSIEPIRFLANTILKYIFDLMQFTIFMLVHFHYKIKNA